ncbi:MAG: hypothetical protein JW850_16770 [Thermoflexales bacterium]|nr:hypothetical protein [Thermoflexales bacterium]
MKRGTIRHLIETFERAFEQLHIAISPYDLESLAVTVHRVMSGPARNFHTPQHVSDLLDPDDPIQSLAAPFHDIVYYQVDRGFSPELRGIICPYIHENEEEIFIKTGVDAGDRSLALLLRVFDFEAGQKLSLPAGLNEFLSALVVTKKLEGIVGERDLLQIAACIEATIPFSGHDEQGRGHFEILAERLSAASRALHLSMTGEDVEDAVKRAVIFANKDVASFAERDVGRFLGDTWKLLPEMNIALRLGGVYSIKEYRHALQKMETFLSALNPDNIFHCYKGVPSPGEFQSLVDLAHSNIGVACEYLGAKLLTAAILESLADLTGGDAPQSLFMGEIHLEGQDEKRLEDYLPAVPNLADHSSVVFKLLEQGRASESSFDMKQAPLSLFLYKSAGPAQIKLLLDEAKAMFGGQLSAREFLDKLDCSLVRAVAGACAAMVPTRRQALLQLC